MGEGGGARWWAVRLSVIAACLFFIFFGINLLIASYKLTSPHYFVLTFFASNFIILFSGAILVGFCIQVFIRLKGKSGFPVESDEKESPFESGPKEE